jgi:uncharacterized membrane protein
METTVRTLTVGGIIGGGFKTGLKNAPSIIGAAVLWLLTIWIPYINVGTTIGMVSIVVAMSKGGIVSPLEIFDGKYRRYMGEFFILAGLRQLGIFFGLIFLIFPAIVIAIAWSQAFYLLIDRRLNPIECLKTSNDLTYGHKWTIFGGLFLLGLCYAVITAILMAVTGSDFMSVGSILIRLLLLLLFFPVMLGAWAHIYRSLCGTAEPANV